MTTKDWIYLGLMVLTALAFYCNGFYAGVMRSRKVYESLLNDAGDQEEIPSVIDENKLAEQDNIFAECFPSRQIHIEVQRRNLPGDFHNN